MDGRTDREPAGPRFGPAPGRAAPWLPQRLRRIAAPAALGAGGRRRRAGRARRGLGFPALPRLGWAGAATALPPLLLLLRLLLLRLLHLLPLSSPSPASPPRLARTAPHGPRGLGAGTPAPRVGRTQGEAAGDSVVASRPRITASLPNPEALRLERARAGRGAPCWLRLGTAGGRVPTRPPARGPGARRWESQVPQMPRRRYLFCLGLSHPRPWRSPAWALLCHFPCLVSGTKPVNSDPV